MRALLSTITTYLAFTIAGLAGAVVLSPRDVQIKSIDFEIGIVELFNFSMDTQPLDGFRFCTQDDNETLKYTSSGGFNGKTIAAGDSFFVHYNNDAPGGALNAINRSTLGGVMALPLNNDAYGLSLYFPPVNFNNGNTMADHAQWNINGVDNTTADERADEAETGGVWKDQNQWISTTPDTRRIVLTDYSGDELHGPRSYSCVASNVWTWYRFEEPLVAESEDLADHAISNATYFLAGTIHHGWSEWYDHPNQSIDNRHSLSQFFSKPIPQKNNSPTFTDFTLETIMQFNPGGEFIDFMSWGTGSGFFDTNCLISGGWIDVGSDDFSISIRDQENGTTTSTDINYPIDFPADHQWHHIAFVKSGGDLSLFIDYTLRATTTLPPASDGSFSFDTDARIRLGSAPNNTNTADTNNVADEIRFTLAALTPNQFLYPSQPLIRSLSKEATITMRVLAKTNTMYRVEGTSSPTNSWSPGGSFTSANPQINLDLGNPSGLNYFRIVEP